MNHTKFEFISKIIFLFPNKKVFFQICKTWYVALIYIYLQDVHHSHMGDPNHTDIDW
jgi:hypothetical protein